jgi:hypothetical protein
MTTFISFARRHNADQSIDSICTRCYQTIGREHNEDILNRAEQNHSCDPNGEHLFFYPDTQFTGALAALDTF